MPQNTYLQLKDLATTKKIWFEQICPTYGASPLALEHIPLSQCLGRTLASPMPARVSSPAFHGAAMDGIAVLATDTFGASQNTPKRLFIGKNAHWINTGYPLPKNTNAVIMMEHFVAEHANPNGSAIVIEKAVFPWQHVRKLGEDFVASEIVLPPGIVIGAYELGALAAAGVYTPLVYARPKVIFIPSGSELLPLCEITPELLATGSCLPEFNSLVISALVADVGGETDVLPIVPDDPQEIEKVLQQAVASDAHLIILNAGSSAGSFDYTSSIIEKLGEVWVHGVNIMPGKPTILGKIENKPIIGLPGYPVSAIISFEEFGQTILCRWQGREKQPRLTATAIASQNIPSRAGMEEVVRVKLGNVDNTLIAVPMARGAGIVSSLSRADGIIRIEANTEGIFSDKPTPVQLLRNSETIDGALLVVGSHDNTLDIIDSFLRKHHPRVSLTSAHVGSMGGLIALKEGRCHLAGSHLLCEKTGVYNQGAIQEYLQDTPVHLVRLVDREQGFIVPVGNPQNIATINDLVKKDIVFINRQRGSGTRVLLDWLMKNENISSEHITGYDDEEYTHMTVAAAILSGKATVGLGVRAAAGALGLDFIPVGVEEYDLVIPQRFWQDQRILALLDVIRSTSFKETVTNLGGYSTHTTGELIWSSS